MGSEMCIRDSATAVICNNRNATQHYLPPVLGDRRLATGSTGRRSHVTPKLDHPPLSSKRAGRLRTGQLAQGRLRVRRKRSQTCERERCLTHGRASSGRASPPWCPWQSPIGTVRRAIDTPVAQSNHARCHRRLDRSPRAAVCMRGSTTRGSAWSRSCSRRAVEPLWKAAAGDGRGAARAGGAVGQHDIR